MLGMLYVGQAGWSCIWQLYQSLQGWSEGCGWRCSCKGGARIQEEPVPTLMAKASSSDMDKNLGQTSSSNGK